MAAGPINKSELVSMIRSGFLAHWQHTAKESMQL